MYPPANKKETQTFIGVVGYRRMHILDYTLTVNAFDQVSQWKSNFTWGSEQQQAFEPIKQEILHAVALETVQTGQDVKKHLVCQSRGEWPHLEPLAERTRRDWRLMPSGFWIQGLRRYKACYAPSEKEILTAYEGAWATLEVIGTKAQLLLASWLPVLDVQATETTQTKWVALIMQRALMGKPQPPRNLRIYQGLAQRQRFGISPEEEVTLAEEALLHNKLPENEKKYAMFADGSCHTVGKHYTWKAVV